MYYWTRSCIKKTPQHTGIPADILERCEFKGVTPSLGYLGSTNRKDAGKFNKMSSSSRSAKCCRAMNHDLSDKGQWLRISLEVLFYCWWKKSGDHQLIFSSLSHHLQGFFRYIRGGAAFLPSTIWFLSFRIMWLIRVGQEHAESMFNVWHRSCCTFPESNITTASHTYE